jgi:selenocysteine lyase/cysteine desulfurase
MRQLLFDAAASVAATPGVLAAVRDALSQYGSVHRGAGPRSRSSSALYEQARDVVGQHFDVPPTHAVVFTSNTTDALVHLARALSPRRVRVGRHEHSANVLSWRQAGHTLVHEGHADLVAMSGGSNITGCLPAIPCVPSTTPTVWDCSQRVAHAPIHIGPGVDAMAFSGHKIGAPFGAGCLIAPKAWLEHNPLCLGGGSVEYFDDLSIVEKSPPHNWESGTPNLVGAVAIAAALRELDHERIAEHDALVASWYRRHIPTEPLWECFGSVLMLPWNDTTARLPELLPQLECRYGAFCCYTAFTDRLGPRHSRWWGGLRLSAHLSVTEADVAAVGRALCSLSR